MDNNNPIVPGPTPAPQPAPQQPIPQAPVSAPPTGDSKKMILWLIVGFVVIIALVGAIYFFISRQQPAKEGQPATITQTQTPMPAVEENLEVDLNSVNVESALDSDFSSVDQDLQQL